jgi:hypothetical protein
MYYDITFVQFCMGLALVSSIASSLIIYLA